MQQNINRRDFLLLKPQPTDTTLPDTDTASALFRQHLRHVPQVDPAFWALSLGGLVSKPLVFTYQQFLALPSVTLPVTLACVGSTPEHPLIGHALWRGVPLRSLLDQARPDAGAGYIQCYSADGYTTYIERDRLEQAVLAYSMNGQPLPLEHGCPVRLVVPGLYGYKMPKWLQRLQVTDTPVNGFWEGRGWSAEGTAQTTSAIFSPRHLEAVSGEVMFSGVAYAGERDIARVEISIDDGPWMPVPFEAAARYSWTPWQTRWTPPCPGDYRVRVRATDSAGFTQPDTGRAFPHGSTAVQSIIIRVTA